MNIVEKQARRALERDLRPGEAVRGFTLCEWDNGRQTVQALYRLGQSKGFFAFTDRRVFLIPTRVSQLMSWTFGELNAVGTRGVDEFLTVAFDATTSLDMIVGDPAVSRAVTARWQEHLAAAERVFQEQYRTPDFDQLVLEEMDKHLAAGRPFPDAVHQVAVRTQNILLGVCRDKAVAGSAAFAAARIARTHPAGPPAADVEGAAPVAP